MRGDERLGWSKEAIKARVTLSPPVLLRWVAVPILAFAALVFAVWHFGAVAALVPGWLLAAAIVIFGVLQLREVWAEGGGWADAVGPLLLIILPVALGVLFTLKLLFQ